jgi:hypothetical protein
VRRDSERDRVAIARMNLVNLRCLQIASARYAARRLERALERAASERASGERSRELRALGQAPLRASTNPVGPAS